MADKINSGAVMVVGGGIAGIQSALDLADAGFRVYLVEESPSIGGVMPQLDKTFPTNDCAMCILAPKLVDTGRHPNIRILCNSEVKSIAGEVGDFQVEVVNHSTFVDLEKCNGCGDCVQYCPVSVPSGFDEKAGRSKAIDRPFPQAIPNVFSISKEGMAPCRMGCPAQANVQAYVALAAQERWAEALEVIKRKIPFPGTLGRICHHPCELKCNRKDMEAPVAIRDVKRFIADYAYEHPDIREEYQKLKEERKRKNREEGASYIDPFVVDDTRGAGYRVAIIGAGPAGLTAAADLSDMGYDVEIFEEETSPGGMMKWVIPDFRLNKDYLDKEIRMLIEEHPFRINHGKMFGRDFTLADLRSQNFGAVFIAIGAQSGQGLKVAGSGAEGVFQGLDFIKKVNRGEFDAGSLKDKKIAIMGGGNVAMDAARMALRLGGMAVIVYRRSLKEMPATEEEIGMAREEGIEFEFLTNPVEFLVEGGRIHGMRCIRMELGAPDESGRRRPVAIDGSEFDMPCDMAILAIGQKVDAACLEKDNLALEWGLLKVDPLTLQTSLENVFAGGDVVTGPASVIEAIQDGHDAAISIDRFLHKEDLRKGREETPLLAGTPKREHYEAMPRVESRRAPLKERLWNFHEVTLTMTKEEAVRESKRCLNCGLCCECMQCVASCGRGAVDHRMKDRVQTFRVGSVIIAPGYEKFLPQKGGSFGYNLYPNVVTSIQFERMLSASGPLNGHLARPSDHSVPKKIAWLQCVGSRDASCNRPWCSSICCMYSTKEAVIAREHAPGLEAHIYYMDIRSFGKNYEQYIERAKSEYGVQYRATRVPRMEQNPVSKNLRIRYADEDSGEVKEEEYDMVVLSVGMQPCDKMGSLADLFHIGLNEYGFVETPPFQSTGTNRPGIYVAGAISEPKDIPEAVTEASSAAARAGADIFEARGAEVTEKTYPEEKDVRDESPRVGVFVCHCGTNIGSVVDLPAVKESLRNEPFVAFINDYLYTCSQDTQEVIKEKIREMNLNRIVIASCTPRTHEELFQDTIRETGLNPYLFQMANIRDQCSWVHRDDREKATKKAVELIRMAIAKTARLFPVAQKEVPLVQKALVIGGGVSGMSAALAIADQGYEVYLVEKDAEPGGDMREIYLGYRDENPQQMLKDAMERTLRHPHIRVFLSSEVAEISGYVGNFTSRIRTLEGFEEIQHGVVIVATGALPYEPTEYLYGKSEKVLTQRSLEKMLYENNFPANKCRELVMIQCVGSRNDEHPWCSRVCCSNALKNALAIEEASPDTRIFVLYRDIRTYGFKEDYLYRKAREKGILFIRYEEEKPPVVSEKNGELEIVVTDHILRRDIAFHPDLLVLSTGIVPGDNEKIAQLLKVPLNSDKFFVEAHAKLRPVDFANDGVYLCGTAHSPRFVSESITQAQAAAARALTVLSRKTLKTKGIVVQVNPRKCVGCEICVGVCSYEARRFDPEKGYVTVNEILCQGCGACAAACPNGATQQNQFTSKQIFSMIDALSASK
ncbi:FAD-dependent oxidoreductase [Candidatus Sumerlaeota bacterium]|nr:FAD-dependent oxidoreductase [Candidatus Sumerlaeota bacterium]